MSQAAYALPTDDLAPNAILSTGSSEMVGYPASNMVAAYDANQNRPSILTDYGAGAWMHQYASIIAPAYAVLVYYSYAAGRLVYLQGNNADSWGVGVPYQQQFEILGPHADGEYINTIMQVLGGPNYTHWRVVHEGTGSRVPQVTRLMLLSNIRPMISTVRHIDYKYGMRGGERHRRIVMETPLGIRTKYPLGGKERWVEGEVPANAAGHAELQTLRRATLGGALPFLFWPDMEVNDPWYVEFDEDEHTFTHEGPDYYPQTFRLREIARGLSWP